MNSSTDNMDVGIHHSGCQPGCQPGRWRLSLGKCAVGALALARNPRIVRARGAVVVGGGGEVKPKLKTCRFQRGGGRDLEFDGSIETVTERE